MVLLKRNPVNDRWVLRTLWKTSNNNNLLEALRPISSRAAQRTIIREGRKVNKGKGLSPLAYYSTQGWGFA
jgi:hypothetical protein